MKSAIFFALFAAVLAAPQKLRSPDEDVQVLTDIRDGPVEANYNNVLELSNGISLQETGSEGVNGVSNKEGVYRFTAPDGTHVEVQYTADETGFHPRGDHLPVDHPKPPHALEQIRLTEELRAKGVQWDERGFVI